MLRRPIRKNKRNHSKNDWAETSNPYLLASVWKEVEAGLFGQKCEQQCWCELEQNALLSR